MSALAKPKVFASIMFLLFAMAAATWSFDQYLSNRNETAEIIQLVLDGPVAERILNRGQLRVGVRNDFAPFGQFGADDNLVGFDIDLAREFAKRWIGDADAITLVPLSAPDRIPRLVSGEVDILMASLRHKRERDAIIDFSQTYFLDGQSLLVRANSGVASLADLGGRTVAAIQGSTAIDELQNLADNAGIHIQIVTYPEYPQALEALGIGRADALTANSVVLTQFAQNNPGLQLVGGRFTQEPYAIGVPQDDSHLRELVNFTLQDMKKDGTYDAIYRQWFPTDQPFALEVSPGDWPYSLENLPLSLAATNRSTIEKILERGTILAGVPEDWAPFGSPDASGNWQGFDIDIVREFARRWLGNENAVTFVAAPEVEHMVRLTSGDLDLIAAGLVQRREWADTIDFSQTYVGPPITNEPLSIGLPQNDSPFRELVNVTLQEMKTDGSYADIHSRWFGSGAPTFDVELLPGDADYLLLPYRDQATAPRITASGVSTIKRVRERGNLLRVGIDLNTAPFGFLDASGQVSGFDAELIQLVAEQWGVGIEFIATTPSDRIAKLAAGEVDIIASAMPHTKEAEADIEFSQTYFMNGQALLVNSASGITDLAGLNELPVAALQDSSAIDLLRAYADANAVLLNIAPYPTYQAAIDALKNGQITALTADLITLAQIAKNDPDVTIIGDIYTQEPFGLGLAPGDSYFNNLTNFTLQNLKEQGRYDELYRKWFGNDIALYDLEILPGTWPYTFEQSPTTLDKPVRSKVDEIQLQGKFVAGVKFDFQPFGFLDENNQLAGFEVDLMREFAKRWLGDANAVEFVQVTSANRIDTLVADELDIVAASMTHKRERDELIDFSQTYYVDGQSLLVRSDSGINSVEDLEGKLVAAIQGSAAIENLQSAARRTGVSFELLPFQEYLQAVEAVKAGQVDALTTVGVALAQFAQDDPNLTVAGESFTSEPYGLGIPNYDDRFKDLVNFTLQSVVLDGTYDRMYVKWFGGSGTNTVESSNVDIYDVDIWPGDSYLDIDLTPMVRLPAGEFIRGNANGFPDERFEQAVYLDEFYIDQHEVTNRQYSKCVEAGRCTLPRLPRSVNFGSYYAESSFGNFPVIWVSWNDATDYCSFVGKRLPTEAEWEKAARGGQPQLYPWGDAEPADQANFDYARLDVVPVGSFSADISPYGVEDMAGNVREWVSDWYQWDYYPNASTQNPLGPDGGVTRVLRGGSWNDAALYLRSTVRKNFLPESFDSNLGFRCASTTFPPSR